MSNYIYNDEDNAPMNDDPWMKYTTYSCKAEAEAIENGEYFRDLIAEREERMQQHEEWMDNLLDDLKLEGKCRECPYIIETAEGFMDDDGFVTFEQKEFIRLTCVGCHGKGTGKIQPEHEERLIKEWNEIVDWVKMYGMNQIHCPWCPKVYEVYGKYKDPDDEWRALEDACGDCKYFGED